MQMLNAPNALIVILSFWQVLNLLKEAKGQKIWTKNRIELKNSISKKNCKASKTFVGFPS